MVETFFCRCCFKRKNIALKNIERNMCTSCSQKSFERSTHLRKDKPGELKVKVSKGKVKDLSKYYDRLVRTTT